MLPNSYRGKEIQINWFHASHWPGISVQGYNELRAPCGVKPINAIRPLKRGQEKLKIHADTLQTQQFCLRKGAASFPNKETNIWRCIASSKLTFQKTHPFKITNVAFETHLISINWYYVNGPSQDSNMNTHRFATSFLCPDCFSC